MKPLEDAARSRGREADWIVGMNATRAYGPLRRPRKRPLRGPRPDPDPEATRRPGEREIQDFEPEKFWTVHALFA